MQSQVYSLSKVTTRAHKKVTYLTTFFFFGNQQTCNYFYVCELLKKKVTANVNPSDIKVNTLVGRWQFNAPWIKKGTREHELSN